jgi:hypothetical protein
MTTIHGNSGILTMSRDELENVEHLARVQERWKCAEVADDYAAKLMQWTYEAERAGKKDEANAFRAQRVAAANLANQIRARKD